MILITKTSDQTRQRGCMYVCMYACIFIKLHIAAQFGPVILSVSTIGGGGDTTIPSPGRSPKQSLPEIDLRRPHMVGKLAPNSTHFTRGLVKYIPGRGSFRAVPSQNGKK